MIASLSNFLTSVCGNPRSPLPLLTLSLPFFLLDQLTKWVVVWNLPIGIRIPVVPGFFNLVHVQNTGAAFGIGANNNAFFLGLSAFALALLLGLWRRGKFQLRGTRIAVALLLAGICGNLADRIVHGHVVDFLDFVLPWYGSWPAFNVADSCICVAAGLLVASAFLPDTTRTDEAGKLEGSS